MFFCSTSSGCDICFPKLLLLMVFNLFGHHPSPSHHHSWVWFPHQVLGCSSKHSSPNAPDPAPHRQSSVGWESHCHSQIWSIQAFIPLVSQNLCPTADPIEPGPSTRLLPLSPTISHGYMHADPSTGMNVNICQIFLKAHTLQLHHIENTEG